MFDEVLTKTYYGNSIGEWMLSFFLIIASAVLAKAIYWLLGRFVKKLTRRTNNDFDDILVDKLEEPIVFAIIIFGIWYSLQLLNLSELTRKVIESAYYILIIFDVAWVLTRLLDTVIQKFINPLVSASNSHLDDHLMPIISKGLKLSVWVTAILVALNNAGYNVSAVLASLGIGGLAFALAAKDTIANLFGSFTIFVDKPFMIGDRVILKGYDGHIREIGLRSTRLQTLNGRMITIPNSKVADESIENISSEPNRKITLDLGMTYGTNHEQMQKAMDTLKDIAAQNSNVEDKVATVFNAFNDFTLNIRFNYYIKKDMDISNTLSEINLEILRRFNEEGLEFAFPTQTVYTK